MSETTLVGNTLNRDAWLLGHEITPNIERALSLEEITHYRQKKGEIVPALQRGFVLPGAIPLQAVSVELTRYPIEETDCFEWLGHMEQFADQYFGSKVNLRKMFTLPTRLPWKEVLPVFDPAGLTNRQMVDKALKAQGLQVYEGTDVQALTGATAEVSKLYLIERTAKPVPATMGLPPKYARHWFGGRQTLPLHLRGYGIGTGLLYKLEKKFLDHDATTASWFPKILFRPMTTWRSVTITRAAAWCTSPGASRPTRVRTSASARQLSFPQNLNPDFPTIGSDGARQMLCAIFFCHTIEPAVKLAEHFCKKCLVTICHRFRNCVPSFIP